jgi:hypothetical protein
MSYPYTALYLEARQAKQRLVDFFQSGQDRHAAGESPRITRERPLRPWKRLTATARQPKIPAICHLS